MRPLIETVAFHSTNPSGRISTLAAPGSGEKYTGVSCDHAAAETSHADANTTTAVKGIRIMNLRTECNVPAAAHKRPGDHPYSRQRERSCARITRRSLKEEEPNRGHCTASHRQIPAERRSPAPEQPGNHRYKCAREVNRRSHV